MTLDKPFHLSEPKLPHLQSVCSDVYPMGNCSRDKGWYISEFSEFSSVPNTYQILQISKLSIRKEMFAEQRRGMKEWWGDSKPRLSVGPENKAEKKLDRMWKGPDTWIFGEQLGIVGLWVVVW